MLQFLQPAYWIAFAGLLLPILIHLWNRRKGRTVKVGSIELLQVAEEQSWSSLQLSDLWRLVLRLLLLGCFVFLLMAPHWQTSGNQQKGEKWALIDVAYLEHPALAIITDSLQANDYELRLFTPGFPLLENTQQPVAEEQYWSLLHDLSNLQVPPDSVFVLAHPGRHHFQGQRPSLSIPLQWKSLPVSSSHYFVAKAWRNADELMLLIGESDREGTQFHQQGIPFEHKAGEYELAAFPTLNIQQSKPGEDWTIGFLNQPEDAVPVLDSFYYRVYLQSDPDFNLDKAYLAAALRAVSKYLKIPIHFQELANESKGPGAQDWLFWLSENEVPDSLRALFAGNLAIFQPRIAPQGSFFVKATGEYHLVKRLADSGDQSWLLPHELIDMLFARPAQAVRSDREQQALAISQVLPRVEADSKSIRKGENNHLQSLFFPIWLVILMLFVLERSHAFYTLKA